MHIFFLLLFFVSTTIHLYASLKQNKTLRAKSKPFIIIALMGFYAFSASSIRWTIITALFFSWLGDVLLIPHGLKWFTSGGISFMISHALFIASYCKDINFDSLHAAAIIALAFIFTGAVSFIFSKLKPFLPKQLFYPMYLYLLINGCMNCFAVFRTISCTNASTIITCIGAFLFFISDSCLFFVRFNKNSILKTHFAVMLTYCLGEFLIILGLI